MACRLRPRTSGEWSATHSRSVRCGCVGADWSASILLA